MNKPLSGFVVTVVAIALGRFFAGQISGGSSVDPLIEPYMAEFDANPKYKARFEGLDRQGVYQAAFKLASAGAKRLPIEDLVARMQLIAQVLKGADETTCGEIVIGKKQGAFESAFERLPEELRKRWFELSFKAVKAEIDEVEFVKPEDELVQRAFLELTAQMDDDDRALVDRVMAALSRGFPEVSPAEACRAGRLIYDSFPKINTSSQEAVAKVFVL